MGEIGNVGRIPCEARAILRQIFYLIKLASETEAVSGGGTSAATAAVV